MNSLARFSRTSCLKNSDEIGYFDGVVVVVVLAGVALALGVLLPFELWEGVGLSDGGWMKSGSCIRSWASSVSSIASAKMSCVLPLIWGATGDGTEKAFYRKTGIRRRIYDVYTREPGVFSRWLVKMTYPLASSSRSNFRTGAVGFLINPCCAKAALE